jgi:hypothetical protein
MGNPVSAKLVAKATQIGTTQPAPNFPNAGIATVLPFRGPREPSIKVEKLIFDYQLLVTCDLKEDEDEQSTSEQAKNSPKAADPSGKQGTTVAMPQKPVVPPLITTDDTGSTLTSGDSKPSSPTKAQTDRSLTTAEVSELM